MPLGPPHLGPCGADHLLHTWRPPPIKRIGVSWGWKVIFQGGLRVAQQARQTAPCYSVGKCWTHSGFVQSLTTTLQDRMWGEGQKRLCPRVKGKMISVPETNKGGIKFEKKDSLRKKKK